MITLRKSEERGHFNYGWLDTFHTFSFDRYYDPNHMGFGSLRVLNEDRVAPGKGFPSHPHRDMEILTYVLSGALEHQDSMGNGSVIRAGEIQGMTAGTGIFHSEKNHSDEEPVHFLQIWIVPDSNGLTPGYQQKSFAGTQQQNDFLLMASRQGLHDSVQLHQDVTLYTARLQAEQEMIYRLKPGRHAWLQVVRGKVRLNNTRLKGGDAAAAGEEESLRLKAEQNSEVLLFDLA